MYSAVNRRRTGVSATAGSGIGFPLPAAGIPWAAAAVVVGGTPVGLRPPSVPPAAAAPALGLPAAGNGKLIPDPAVSEKPVRRRFTAEYKLRILHEADRCTASGQLGALLRGEGLYSSLLSCC